MLIRPERPSDAAAIRAVTVAAFAASAYGHNGEAGIVEALRADGALAISLVAEEDGEVIGHVAFSPVTIGGVEGWQGLGPVSVAPAWQGRGVGQALIRDGLGSIEALGADGCVVLGEPAYYGRFGFESDSELRFGTEASPYLQRLVWRGPAPSGEVRYHPSFLA